MLSARERERERDRERDREKEKKGGREREKGREIENVEKFRSEIVVKGVREYEEKAEARTHVSVPVPLFFNFLLVFC